MNCLRQFHETETRVEQFSSPILTALLHAVTLREYGWVIWPKVNDFAAWCGTAGKPICQCALFGEWKGDERVADLGVLMVCLLELLRVGSVCAEVEEKRWNSYLEIKLLPRGQWRDNMAVRPREYRRCTCMKASAHNFGKHNKLQCRPDALARHIWHRGRCIDECNSIPDDK